MVVRSRSIAVVVTVALGIVAQSSQAAAPTRRSKRAPRYKVVELKETGVIEGKVIFKGTVPAPQTLTVPIKDAVCTQHPIVDETLVVSKDGKVRNAVISLDGLASGKPFPSHGKYVLDQKGCVFRPHVVVVPPREELTVLNSDGILHNVHSRSLLNREFNKAMPGSVKEMKVKFRRAERIAVQCDAHNWMSAWIVVAPNPYCVVSDPEGVFRLEQVPPGTHTITLWHEKLGTRKQSVTVEPGKTAKIQFVLETK